MARPVMTCPAACSADAIASPPVSFSFVLVSLIVSTKHRTDAGPSCGAGLRSLLVIIEPTRRCGFRL